MAALELLNTSAFGRLFFRLVKKWLEITGTASGKMNIIWVPPMSTILPEFRNTGPEPFEVELIRCASILSPFRPRITNSHRLSSKLYEMEACFLDTTLEGPRSISTRSSGRSVACESFSTYLIVVVHKPFSLTHFETLNGCQKEPIRRFRTTIIRALEAGQFFVFIYSNFILSTQKKSWKYFVANYFSCKSSGDSNGFCCWSWTSKSTSRSISPLSAGSSVSSGMSSDTVSPFVLVESACSLMCCVVRYSMFSSSESPKSDSSLLPSTSSLFRSTNGPRFRFVPPEVPVFEFDPVLEPVPVPYWGSSSSLSSPSKIVSSNTNRFFGAS
ncbi:hypothetical protein OGAPHI_005103 [Ogataea philodendri]|uniref:Uncharacterized protein n=1 Tax=Ogataea philodendri TaxID=1378263 RepID=A0A9P8P2N7_9ASCO|nr:uncharacterized protein OGAPHI_005103 [Ogataea philodendri]KAH3663702.1 hypothetical protein OGAPHI_005103 [Ogataea philodendri]